MKVAVGVSARHVHLTKETYKKLFNKDTLEVFKNLKIEGQFASTDCVTIKTQKSEFKNIRILGPLREYDQVEIAKTDAFKLGINPPIRTSGDVSGSEPITVIGPKGSIDLKEGCIQAVRHLHISAEEAEENGFQDGQALAIKVEGEKSAILENVKVKISKTTNSEIHLDTDDANSCLIKDGDLLEVVGLRYE